MRREWALFAALAVALLAVPLVFVLTGDEDDESPGPAMKAERATGPTGLPELLITVSDRRNVPATTGDEPSVVLRCRDRGDRVVFRGRYAWPLERDGEEPTPHIHQPAASAELRRIQSCALADTSPRLQAELPVR